MKSACLGLVLCTALLAGCHSRPEIAVSEQQTLVMEANVLAAGISAESPEFSSSDIQATASAKLFNERREPVTVHYRFYWYDARGLEI
ncbi:MAG: YcfL family protein, partial [Kluyvera sp.]